MDSAEKLVEDEAARAPADGGDVRHDPPPAPSSSFLETAARVAIVGLFVLATLYTIYFARDFLIPITVAIFLKIVLNPLVRRLFKWGVPEAAGAALVIMVTVLGAVGVVYELLGPANDWVARAPAILRQTESKLRDFKQSVQNVSRAAEEVEKIADVDGEREGAAVELRGPTLTTLAFESTRNFAASAVATIVLLYLLLASGDLFLRKMITVLPRLEDKVRAVDLSRELERSISHYLLTISCINVGLGALVAFAMYLLGMPNALLWGMMVTIFNYVPYLGPLASLIVLTITALVTFNDTGRAISVGGTFFILNTLEAYFVTPSVLGRRMQMNPVAIFVAVIFFGWAWGVAGVLVTVPILATLRLCCDHIEPLAPVGEFLGG